MIKKGNVWLTKFKMLLLHLQRVDPKAFPSLRRKGNVPPTQHKPITNVNSLSKDEPEFYNAMLNSMAMELCNKMKAWDERIKKAKKEHERR